MHALRMAAVAGFLAASSLVAAAPAAAESEPPGAGSAPGELHGVPSELQLAIAALGPEAASGSASHGGSSGALTSGEPSSTAWTSEAVLNCHPAGGSHPDPERACRELEAASGDVSAIRPNPGPCTLEYAPVRATARGHWRGELVEFDETYPNRCQMLRDTRAVFNF